MKRLQLEFRTLAIIFLSVPVLVFVIESLGGAGKRGSLLFTLLFWLALIQGLIALAAIGQVTRAQWVLPIKRLLLSFHPLLLLIFFLFLFMGFQLNIYPWADDPGFWLNKQFFMFRNLALLLLAYVFARQFSIEVIRDGEKKFLYAVLYLFTFVSSQSLAAFDWVMSLEYPWFSSLFGGYFFIESLYTAIALSCIFCYFLLKESDGEQKKALKKTHKDVATLLFAFSVIWAYFFFSQFLIIWYGNIPEEVIFFARRFSNPRYLFFSFVILGSLFPVPFLGLLFIRIKSNPLLVVIIAGVVISGVFIERLVFILPSATVQAPALLLEFFMMAALLVMTFLNRETLISRYY